MIHRNRIKLCFNRIDHDEEPEVLQGETDNPRKKRWYPGTCAFPLEAFIASPPIS